MSTEISNQILARLQDEMSRNISSIKQKVSEWLDRPQIGGIESMRESMAEVSGGLSLLNRKEAAELSDEIMAVMVALQKRVTDAGDTKPEDFDNAGAEIASAILILDDYIDRLTDKHHDENEHILEILRVMQSLKEDTASRSSYTVPPKITKDTYQALAAKVSEVIETSRNQIEQYAHDPDKPFNASALISHNKNLINMFAVLDLKEPQLLLQKINQMLVEQLSESQWIDVAEAMILVEETLNQMQSHRSPAVNTYAEAVAEQTRHSRELEVNHLVRETGEVAFRFFETMRKKVVHDGYVHADQGWRDAALRLAHYSAIAELVELLPLAEALKSMGKSYAAIFLQGKADNPVFAAVIDSLVGAEYIFFELSESGHPSSQDIVFLRESVESIGRYIPVTSEAERLFAGFIDTDIESGQEEREDLSGEFSQILTGGLDSLDRFGAPVDMQISADAANANTEDETLPLDMVHVASVSGRVADSPLTNLDAVNIHGNVMTDQTANIPKASDTSDSGMPVSINDQERPVSQKETADYGAASETSVTHALSDEENRLNQSVVADFDTIHGKQEAAVSHPSQIVAEPASVFIPFFRDKNIADLDTLPIPQSKQAFVAAHADAVMDEEIREFFIEELGELISLLNDVYPQWLEASDSQALTTELRRAFHTLKGSGRTVGHESLGEFAWQHEQLLNRVLDNHYRANPLVQSTVGDAIDLLNILNQQSDFTELKGALLQQAAAAEAVREALMEDADVGEEAESFLRISKQCRLHDGKTWDESVAEALLSAANSIPENMLSEEKAHNAEAASAPETSDIPHHDVAALGQEHDEQEALDADVTESRDMDFELFAPEQYTPSADESAHVASENHDGIDFALAEAGTPFTAVQEEQSESEKAWVSPFSLADETDTAADMADAVQETGVPQVDNEDENTQTFTLSDDFNFADTVAEAGEASEDAAFDDDLFALADADQHQVDEVFSADDAAQNSHSALQETADFLDETWLEQDAFAASNDELPVSTSIADQENIAARQAAAPHGVAKKLAMTLEKGLAATSDADVPDAAVQAAMQEVIRRQLEQEWLNDPQHMADIASAVQAELAAKDGKLAQQASNLLSQMARNREDAVEIDFGQDELEELAPIDPRAEQVVRMLEQGLAEHGDDERLSAALLKHQLSDEVLGDSKRLDALLAEINDILFGTPLTAGHDGKMTDDFAASVAQISRAIEEGLALGDLSLEDKEALVAAVRKQLTYPPASLQDSEALKDAVGEHLQRNEILPAEDIQDVLQGAFVPFVEGEPTRNQESTASPSTAEKKLSPQDMLQAMDQAAISTLQKTLDKALGHDSHIDDTVAAGIGMALAHQWQQNNLPLDDSAFASVAAQLRAQNRHDSDDVESVLQALAKRLGLKPVSKRSSAGDSEETLDWLDEVIELAPEQSQNYPDESVLCDIAEPEGPAQHSRGQAATAERSEAPKVTAPSDPLFFNKDSQEGEADIAGQAASVVAEHDQPNRAEALPSTHLAEHSLEQSERPQETAPSDTWFFDKDVQKDEARISQEAASLQDKDSSLQTATVASTDLPEHPTESYAQASEAAESVPEVAWKDLAEDFAPAAQMQEEAFPNEHDLIAQDNTAETIADTDLLAEPNGIQAASLPSDAVTDADWHDATHLPVPMPAAVDTAAQASLPEFDGAAESVTDEMLPSAHAQEDAADMYPPSVSMRPSAAAQRLSRELEELSQHPTLNDAVGRASSQISTTATGPAVFLHAVDKFETLSQQVENTHDPEAINELIESVYDIEDSIEPETAPDWIWRMLDAVEQLLLMYKYEGAAVSLSAASILRQSAHLIEHHKEENNEEEALETINSLISARQERGRMGGGQAEQASAPHSFSSGHYSEELTIDPNANSVLAETFLDEAMALFGRGQLDAEKWDEDLSRVNILDRMRRDMHTLKGSARMAGYMAIGDLSHAVENLIDSILDGYSEASPRAAAILSGAMWQGMIMLDNIRDGYLPQIDPYILNNISDYLNQPLPYPDIAEREREVKEQQRLEAEEAQFRALDMPADIQADEPATSAVDAVEEVFGEGFDSDIDPVLVDIFSDEAEELLQATEQHLENDIASPSVAEDFKRTMHTLKGGARLVGLSAMGDTSHLMESVMEKVPELSVGKVRQARTLLQAGYESLRTMLDAVLRQEMPKPADAVNHSLELFVREGRFEAPKAEPSVASTADAAQMEQSASVAGEHVVDSAAAEQTAPAPAATASDVSEAPEMLQAADNAVPQAAEAAERASQPTASASETVDQEEIAGEATQAASSLPSAGIEHAEDMASSPALRSETVEDKAEMPAPSEKEKPAQDQDRMSDVSRFVRVDSQLLDEIIAMVGEASIMRSRMENISAGVEFNLGELTRISTRIAEQMRRLDNETEAQMLFRREKQGSDDEHFDPLEMDRFTEIQQLSRQLSEAIDDLKNVQDTLANDNTVLRNLASQQGIIQRSLQDRLLTTQLMRFDVNEPRLKRLVRQTAKTLGKEVHFVLEGGQVELERRLLEDVLPALEHMIRNAIAHGIETPAQRRKAGKPEIGTIKLVVGAQSSEVTMRLVDDGQGFDYDRIRSKAREKGILDEALAQDTQYLNSLILRSGFSTAQSLTQISGRGVGMDVVNEMVKQRRGRLTADSLPGKGTEFTVIMPFSMSIAEVLLVDIGGRTYAAPMSSITAVSQVSRTDLQESFAGETVYHRYDERDYRLYVLGSYFEPGNYEFAPEAHQLPVLFIDSGEEAAAFHVDRILNRLEIIVKNVNRQVLNIPGISGATILGDASVVPVLELMDLARRIGSITPQVEEEAPEESTEKRILVVDDSVTMRKVSTRLLERNHFIVETAKDGLDAIDVLQHFKPDLIMLDIEMPRMDGFEFAAHVRQNSDVPNVPIVMVTSRTGDKHRERAGQIGVQGYLGKPYREDILMETLNSLLNTTTGTAS